jgi:hypothetical protein
MISFVQQVRQQVQTSFVQQVRQRVRIVFF